MPRNARFWRNVFLIALAHVALIAGLIRWSVAARASSNPESIVWLGGVGDFTASESEGQELPSPEHVTSSDEPIAKGDEVEEEKPVATVKSEIELPAATPKPTSTATPAPKPTASPVLKPKATPKSVAKPTPKKKLATKASSARSATALQAGPKLAAKSAPTPAKASAKSDKKDKITLAKKDSAPQGGSGQSGSTGKADSASGGNSASEFAWYGNMLHDRFYRAWIQPTANVATGTKISTLVKVRIEKDGRVSRFEIIKPSGIAVVNESVRVVAKQVTEVDAPPTGLIKGDHYDVKINFELTTGEK